MYARSIAKILVAVGFIKADVTAGAGMTATEAGQSMDAIEVQARRWAEALVGGLLRPAVTEQIIEEMCRAHDLEDAAQKGEPSPWNIGLDDEDFPSFRRERISAMRCALKSVGLA